MKRANSVELKADWQQSANPPHLLEYLVDYLTGRISTEGRSYDLPPEIATGAMNSMLKSTTWTNVNGLSVPLEFTFTTFAASANAGAGNIQRITRGVASSFRPEASRRSFQVSFTDATRVVEHRYNDELQELNHGKPAAYITTEKREWSVDRIIAETKVSRERSRKSHSIAGSRMLTTFIIVISLLLPPTFFVIQRWRRASTKSPNQKHM